jgi:hypothetical protein
MIYEVEEGKPFFEAVDDLKRILKDSGSLYRMMQFKGIYVTVSVDSNLDDLATIYDLKKKLKDNNLLNE